jgi:hypothetical protein
MERHGNDRVEPATVQAWIIERLREPVGDWVPEMHLMPVFEFMDEFPHDAAAAVGGDCG